MTTPGSTPVTPDGASGDLPLSDDQIRAGIQRRRQVILDAWEQVAASAAKITIAAGIGDASDFSFTCDGGNTTRYGSESFGYVARGQRAVIDRGDEEDRASDEDWDSLASSLEELAWVTPPTLGDVAEAEMNYHDHDLAMLLYCEQDAAGYYDEEASPLFQRYLQISGWA